MTNDDMMVWIPSKNDDVIYEQPLGQGEGSFKKKMKFSLKKVFSK